MGGPSQGHLRVPRPTYEKTLYDQYSESQAYYGGRGTVELFDGEVLPGLELSKQLDAFRNGSISISVVHRDSMKSGLTAASQIAMYGAAPGVVPGFSHSPAFSMIREGIP
jgi:hypothetical protein